MNRTLRNALCVLTGGHRMMHPLGQTGTSLIAVCSRCAHMAVIDLADLPLPKPRYAGVPERHKLATGTLERWL